jgi:hypothetical protein
LSASFLMQFSPVSETLMKEDSLDLETSEQAESQIDTFIERRHEQRVRDEDDQREEALWREIQQGPQGKQWPLSCSHHFPKGRRCEV